MPEEKTEISYTKEEYRGYLISLITNQDHVAHRWLEFMITIEAGLAVGLGFILLPADSTTLLDSWIEKLIALLIPIIGVVTAIALGIIIARERKWQAWYVHRFNKLSEKDMVFPHGKGSPDSVGGQSIGFISRVVLFLVIGIVLSWLIVAALVLRSVT